MNKIKLYTGGLSAIATGVLGIAVTHAQSVLPAGSITIPSSTAVNMLASVSSIFTDPGIFLVLITAVALPLFFWLVHQLMGLLPRHRGGKK